MNLSPPHVGKQRHQARRLALPLSIEGILQLFSAAYYSSGAFHLAASAKSFSRLLLFSLSISNDDLQNPLSCSCFYLSDCLAVYQVSASAIGG
jgi:hypothetical protein